MILQFVPIACVDRVIEFTATRAGYLVSAIALVPAALSWRRHRLGPIVQLAATVILACIGTGVLGLDGLTVVAFALAFGVFTFLSRRWGLLLGAGALACCACRSWTGLLDPGPVTGAVAFAALATALVRLFSALSARRRQHGADPDDKRGAR